MPGPWENELLNAKVGVNPTGGTLPGGGGGFPGGGAAAGDMLGGLIGDIFSGQQNAANQNIGTRNSARGSLMGELARNPFENAKDAAHWDMMKSGLTGTAWEQAIDPNTWNKLGSSNENIFGVNKGIEDMVKLAGFEEQKSTPWWKKALGAVVPTAIKMFTGGLGG